MLSATGVTFAYGSTPVLRGVSLDVPEGGLVGILGPNGSGKTTLLRVLAGTRKPTSGSVMLDGQDLRRIPRTALARRMAVVPQETQLAFDYTVLEVVLMGRYPHLGAFEIEGPRDYALARRALTATGTAGFETRPFATLSGGEKQRVIIAAALAQISRARPARRPRCCCSTSRRRRSTSRISSKSPRCSAICRDRLHLAIVLSTHDLNFAASLCSSLVLLRDGQVLAAGPTDEVLTTGAVRELYGVDADVHRHAAAGHLVVTPIGGRSRAPGGDRARSLRRRLAVSLAGFGGLAVASIVLAPLVGSTSISLRRAFDRVDPVRRQRRRADLLRRAAAAHARRRAGRRDRSPRPASSSRGCCAIRWRRRSRWASRPARRSARCSRSRSAGRSAASGCPPCRWPASPARSCAVAIVYALARRAAPRPVDQRAAARRRDDERVLLGADPVRAVLRGLRRHLPHPALADGRPRRQQLSAARRGAAAASSSRSRVFAWLARPLNLLSLGADSAETRGLDVRRAQRVAFFSASLATGAAVSVGGPIGFIGIIVPHLVRLMVGSDHRLVLPASALFGAAFLVGCDVLSRTLLAPVELPVGIITALIGGRSSCGCWSEDKTADRF